MKKLLGWAAASMMLLFVLTPFAQAAEFITPEGDSGNVTLSSGETHRNVYIAGGSIFINSDISGDLYGAGGNITVEGAVEQDIVMAGGNITINGQVGGDIRIAGGNITVNAPVGGDILMAGGTLHLTEKATVAGDLVSAGGEMTIDGPVNGAVKIGGGVVTLNNNMPGKVEVMADSALTFGSKAVIPQTISYKGVKEATVREGAQIGTVDFQQLEGRPDNRAGRAVAGLFTLAFIIKVIGLVLAGLLLMKLFPRTSRNSVESMQRGMWANLGIGALTLIVGPILFIILLVTVFGMYIAFFWLLAWLIMLLSSALVASVFVGAWIIQKLSTKGQMAYDWQALVIGIVVLGIVMIIPVIGGLIFILLLMTAFGGLMRQLYGHIKSEQPNVTPQTLNV